MSEPKRTKESAVIVGGSLGGLTTALSLAKVGIASTVLERTQDRTQRGVAILVSGSSIEEAVSRQARSIIAEDLGERAMRQGSLPHAWWDVYCALRRACDAEPLVEILEGVRVTSVGEDETRAWAQNEAGDTWEADLLIGADGYRSLVRRTVDETKPDADYAGYVTWLGQSELPAKWQGARAGGPDFFLAGRRMLAVYPLIEADGFVERAGWGVIDPTWNTLFAEMGALEGTRVQHTPRVADVPDQVYETMARITEQQWDEPWASLVAEDFRQRKVIATPITEYIPERVTTGRIATVGDAAHAQTLMTGAGFREAVDDAEALARALAANSDVPDALAGYEFMRLELMRSSVMGGQSFSRSFSG